MRKFNRISPRPPLKVLHEYVCDDVCALHEIYAQKLNKADVNAVNSVFEWFLCVLVLNQHQMKFNSCASINICHKYVELGSTNLSLVSF